MAVVATAVVLAALIGFAANGEVPVFWLAFALPLIAIATAAQLRSKRALPFLAFALALAPMPVFVPTLLPLGERAIFITDAVFVGVAAWAIRAPGPARGPDRAVGFYGFAIALLAVIGYLNGAEQSALLQDLRGPLYLICGYLIVSRRLQPTDSRNVLLLVGGILWWSVLAITIALVSGQEFLQGRVGSASAFLGDSSQTLEATRFLVASKELGLVAMLSTMALALLGARRGGRRTHLLWLFVPGAFVVFMAFSRQSIVAVVIALLYVMVVTPRRPETVGRMATGAGALGLILAILVISGVAGRYAGENTVIGAQLSGYSDRVISGLRGENATEDPGNRFRTLEIQAAVDYFTAHPAVGGGLGVQYREDLEIEAFNDIEYGRRYVHNVYLWYAVHGGVLGLVAIGFLLARPLVTVLLPAFRGAFPRRDLVLALGAPYLGILVIGLVEPVIHTNASAPLVGGLLAIFAWIEGGAGAAAGPATVDQAADQGRTRVPNRSEQSRS